MKREPIFTDAVIDETGAYRYRLERKWDPTTESLAVVMLNPSTADSTLDDPTIRRVVGFAKSHWWGGIIVANLYAYRATDPADLTRRGYPEGPLNDHHLDAIAALGSTILCAWGARAPQERVDRFVALNAGRSRLMSLGETKSGAPRHPLYALASEHLRDWPEA